MLRELQAAHGFPGASQVAPRKGGCERDGLFPISHLSAHRPQGWTQAHPVSAPAHQSDLHTRQQPPWALPSTSPPPPFSQTTAPPRGPPGCPVPPKTASQLLHPGCPDCTPARHAPTAAAVAPPTCASASPGSVPAPATVHTPLVLPGILSPQPPLGHLLLLQEAARPPIPSPLLSGEGSRPLLAGVPRTPRPFCSLGSPSGTHPQGRPWWRPSPRGQIQPESKGPQPHGDRPNGKLPPSTAGRGPRQTAWVLQGTRGLPRAGCGVSEGPCPAQGARAGANASC